ncbi:TrlF family AAA-like ATPase [Sinorhizobium fredii]|uniref:TrlF family AAA-like ATPase n=1 Tax=Rhizobium fredii TaxID=380 RepID=UPI0004BAA3BC|nr:AAA family ATPase [Sinorhizobium fredii]
MGIKTGRPPQQYLGARFYKCDLQMQTPFDPDHWVGGKFASSEDAAEAYIRACYEAELEVIALTEHNFVSSKEIPLLQAKAKELSKEFGYELVIFPGFEFTANVGKGVHVLAIFEPDADLNEIDHILTKCGVDNPRQLPGGQHASSTLILEDVLNIVQAPTPKGGFRGLVILPHSQSNSGIFDDSKIAGWLQQREFTNPQLLAVEVPKSPSRMNPAWQSLLGSTDDCHVGWKRSRPICCLMSSDAKTLKADAKTSNAIGSKYTWIKMSKPSIEALRQAFLDHDSRIRRGDDFPDRPELGHTHPSIMSIKVRGAKFLADKDLHFSRNLTTLIGGRGTGKSTLVEYLRLALQQEAEIATDTKSQVYKDFLNVRDTLGLSGSSIEVIYDKGPDFKDQQVKLSVSDGTATGIDPELGDINTFLPVKIYSRGQIEAIANDPQKQASVLDDLVRASLEALNNEERDVVRQLRDLIESLKQEHEIAAARGKLIADISNLSGQIDAIKGKHSSLETWSRWSAENQFLAGMETAVGKHLKEIEASVTANDFGYKIPDFSGGNADFLTKYHAHVHAVMAELKADFTAAIMKARASLTAEWQGTGRQDWQKQFKAAEVDNQETIRQLAEIGVKFDAYDELFRRRETAQAQLAQQDRRLSEIAANRDKFKSLYTESLLDIWKRQFQVRSSMAIRLNDQVTKSKNGKPTVRSTVLKHGDFKSFCELMSSFHKHKGTISPTDWEAMLRAAFDLGLREDISPIDVIERWLRDNAEGKTPADFPKDDVSLKKLRSLGEWLTESDLNVLRTHRIADAITISLHRREDGLEVGDLSGHKLSAGQKATTVLSLLLAEGTCPIIIDQPEDDLDNEFVFEQLVPMLRASKEKRQVIVVTHNANVPVNGDAELIIPLEVKDSRGAQKIIDNESAVGALDKYPVQRAVELILEGSSEAFRRRREKYGV